MTTALLMFLGSAAAAGFYAAAVAGLSALERLLAERGRPSATPGLAAFLLREPTSLATACTVAAVFWGTGAGLAAAAVTPAAPWGRLAVQAAVAAALVAALVAWKRLAEAAPRRYADVAAVLALPFYLLLYPLRRPLGAALQRFFPPLTLRDGVLYEEDVRDIADGDDGSVLLDRDEREMIARVFELGETVVREIMVPRIDMVAIEESTPVREVIGIVQEHGHSRLPVYREQIDHIVGFVYAKDWITNFDRLDSLQLGDLVRPAYFVPETKRVDDLLAEMRARRLYLAIVVDEYGGTSGLVTMEDVIEEVVGEIHDELDDEPPLVHALGEGRYRVDAKVDLDDLNERLGVRLPADDYDTLGGFLYALAGKIPAPGDRYHTDELEFTIGSVRGKRITQVDVHVRAAGAAPDTGTGA